MTLKAELRFFQRGVYTPLSRKPKYPPWPTNFGKYPPPGNFVIPLPAYI